MLKFVYDKSGQSEQSQFCRKKTMVGPIKLFGVNLDLSLIKPAQKWQTLKAIVKHKYTQ